MRGTTDGALATSTYVEPAAQPATKLSFLWPAAAVGGVFYASMLPLRFDLAAYQASNGFGLANITFCATTLEDIVVNIAAYAVIGFVAAWYLIHRTTRRCTAAVLTMLPAVGLSLFVEMLQTGIVGRVASWWDVILNIAGAAIGAGAALILCHRFDDWLARFKRNSHDQPFRTATTILATSLLLYHLMPFDFVVSTDALHSAFRRAQLGLTHVHVVDATASPLAPLAQDLGAASFFALFAMLVALNRRRRGVQPMIALFAAVRLGVILAALIEVLQLFTASHVFETADFIQRSMAAALGAWCGVYVIDQYRLTRRLRQTPQGLSLGILVIVLLIQMLVLGGEVDLPHLAHQGHSAAAALILPFESLWRAPLHASFASVVPIIVTYGLLAATIALILSRAHRVAAWPVACLAASILALIVALAESIPTTAALDITEPILATFAAFAAVEVLHAVQTVRSRPQTA